MLNQRMRLNQMPVHSSRAIPLWHSPTSQHRASAVRTCALPEFLRKVFDFESWAPRSSRVWRLQQYQYPEDQQIDPDGPDASMQTLTERINDMRASSTSSSAATSSAAQERSRGNAEDVDGLPPTSSFSDADDDQLSAALGKRVQQIATTTGEWGGSVDEEDMRQGLTGQELRRLLLAKYGKSYDMSFVRRNLPGMPPVVALNILWIHQEQRSFKMTEDQYMEKLDSIAMLTNRLGQTDKVRAFLSAPAKSHKGLPKRPVVGTAISIRLELEEAVVKEWFGSGYE